MCRGVCQHFYCEFAYGHHESTYLVKRVLPGWTLALPIEEAMATLEPDHLGRNSYSYARGEFPNTAEEPGKNTKKHTYRDKVGHDTCVPIGAGT